MRKPIVQVDTLLKADKGRAAGQFAVPPIQYDGAGYPFAVDSSGDRIAICNDANLLLLDLKRRSKRLLRAPLATRLSSGASPSLPRTACMCSYPTTR